MTNPSQNPFQSPIHEVQLPGQVGPPSTQYGIWSSSMPPVADHYFAQLRRPTALTISFWLWIAGVILVVFVPSTIYFLQSEDLGNFLYLQSIEDAEPSSLEDIVLGVRAIAIGSGVALAILSIPFIICAFLLRSGKAAARTVLAVLAVFGLFFAASTLVLAVTLSFSGILAISIWAIVFFIVLLASAITMFLPPANAYIQARTAKFR